MYSLSRFSRSEISNFRSRKFTKCGFSAFLTFRSFSNIQFFGGYSCFYFLGTCDDYFSFQEYLEEKGLILSNVYYRMEDGFFSIGLEIYKGINNE